jgi:hypothetical protein
MTERKETRYIVVVYDQETADQFKAAAEALGLKETQWLRMLGKRAVKKNKEN